MALLVRSRVGPVDTSSELDASNFLRTGINTYGSGCGFQLQERQVAHGSSQGSSPSTSAGGDFSSTWHQGFRPSIPGKCLEKRHRSSDEDSPESDSEEEYWEQSGVPSLEERESKPIYFACHFAPSDSQAFDCRQIECKDIEAVQSVHESIDAPFDTDALFSSHLLQTHTWPNDLQSRPSRLAPGITCFQDISKPSSLKGQITKHPAEKGHGYACQHSQTYHTSDIRKWYLIYQDIFPNTELPHSPFTVRREELCPRMRMMVNRIRSGFSALKPTYHSAHTVSPTKSIGFTSHSPRSAPTSQISAKHVKVERSFYEDNKDESAARSDSKTISEDIVSGVVQRFLHKWAVQRMEATLRNSTTTAYAADSTTNTKAQGFSSNSSQSQKAHKEGRTNSNGYRGKKRKKSDQSNEDDEDEDFQGPVNTVRQSDVNVDSSRLYCPFHWHDPETFSDLNTFEEEYSSCGVVKLDNITRLKQHLRRVHQAPLFFCDRCFAIFDNRPSLAQHHRQKERCSEVVPERFTHKMTEEQVDTIKKRMTTGTTVEKWNFIYLTIFPNGVPPETPYYDGVGPFLRKRLPNALAYAFTIAGISITAAEFHLVLNTAVDQLKHKSQPGHQDHYTLIQSGSTNLISALTTEASTGTATSQNRDILRSSGLTIHHDSAEDTSRHKLDTSVSDGFIDPTWNWSVDHDEEEEEEEEEQDWDLEWQGSIDFLNRTSREGGDHNSASHYSTFDILLPSS